MDGLDIFWWSMVVINGILAVHGVETGTYSLATVNALAIVTAAIIIVDDTDA